MAVTDLTPERLEQLAAWLEEGQAVQYESADALRAFAKLMRHEGNELPLAFVAWSRTADERREVAKALRLYVICPGCTQWVPFGKLCPRCDLLDPEAK